MNILETRGISRSFGNVRALSELDTIVAEGSVCGLVGPNGSGKTTTINLMSGLTAPSSGTLWIDGRDVTSMPAHQVARLGVRRTFQLIRLIPSGTVRENVRCGAIAEVASSGRRWATRRRAHLEVNERVDTIIDQLGLADVANVPNAELPFGTQRAVELGRALVAKPRILLLDEPASGLTAAESAKLGLVIQSFAREGCAVLLVEHDLRFVFDVCDRITVLDFGEKIYEGSPQGAREDATVRAAYLG